MDWIDDRLGPWADEDAHPRIGMLATYLYLFCWGLPLVVGLVGAFYVSYGAWPWGRAFGWFLAVVTFVMAWLWYDD